MRVLEKNFSKLSCLYSGPLCGTCRFVVLLEVQQVPKFPLITVYLGLRVLQWAWCSYSLLWYTMKRWAHLSANVTLLDISAFSAATLLYRSFWEVLTIPVRRLMCVKGMWSRFLPLQIFLCFERYLNSPRLHCFTQGKKALSSSQDHLQLLLPPDKVPRAPRQIPTQLFPSSCTGESPLFQLGCSWRACIPVDSFGLCKTTLFRPKITTRHFVSKSRIRKRTGGKIKCSA